MRIHENILVFYKKLPIYNPQMRKIKCNDIGRIRTNGGKPQQYNDFRAENWAYIETGKRYPIDVIRFSNWNGSLFGNTKNAVKHPTQKPVDLCEYLIKTYTNVDNLVLDNCIGSGTTAIACINTKRNYIGFETNRKYYEIATERIHNKMLSPS